MAIGSSKLHYMLRRARLFSEALVWYDTFDTDLKKKILDWIRQDQLFKQGIDADGEIIGFYSPVTQSINPLKKFNTHFTLYDTGDFYRSMFVTVLKDKIVIDAGSDSFREMKDQQWYTDRILGLTDENIIKLKSEVKEAYIRKAKSILFNNR